VRLGRFVVGNEKSLRRAFRLHLPQKDDTVCTAQRRRLVCDDLSAARFGHWLEGPVDIGAK
jgi:hypothetical protein